MFNCVDIHRTQLRERDVYASVSQVPRDFESSTQFHKNKAIIESQIVITKVNLEFQY